MCARLLLAACPRSPLATCCTATADRTLGSPLAAGYALYGASTQLVLSYGHGVDGFTLQPSGQKSLEER